MGLFAPTDASRTPGVLPAFKRRQHRVDVSFLEGDLQFIQPALAQGRCTVALMYDIGLEAESTTHVVKRVPPHMIVHAEHPLAAAGVWPSELTTEPLILLDLPHTREYFLHLFRLVEVKPRVRHRATGYGIRDGADVPREGARLFRPRISHAFNPGPHPVRQRYDQPVT